MDSFERGDDVRHRTLERISDGVVSLDSDLRYTYVNSGAEDLLGVSRDDLLGASNSTALARTDRPADRRRVQPDHS
jgi:PAS domain S-box-containing protein